MCNNEYTLVRHTTLVVVEFEVFIPDLIVITKLVKQNATPRNKQRT